MCHRARTGRGLATSSGSTPARRLIRIPSLLLSLLFLLVIAGIFSPRISAQSLLPKQSAPPAAPQVETDLLGRTTPRGTVLGFLQTSHRGDYAAAAEYLQMSKEDRRLLGSEIAEKLQSLMDRAFQGQVALIADRPEGSLNPAVGGEREKIGVFRTDDSEQDVVLVRVPGKEGAHLWLFSAETLAHVQELYEQLRMNSIEQHLPSSLVNNRFLGSPIWLWVGVVVLAPVAFLVAWLLMLIVLSPRRLWERYGREDLLPQKWWQVPTPLWFVVAVIIHRIAVGALGIPLLYRFYYSRFIAILIDFGVAWVVWRIVSWAAQRIQRRSAMRGRAVAASFLILGQRVVKALVLVIAAIVILADLGINTTTAVAGLGIGGLAVAFASQKTLENLFGGASVLSDQTIRVGDTIRMGQIQGVVEDVSLRATRLRTLERTQLSIPNGTLATANLENLSARDKMFFNATLGLRYETTADQLRYVLAEIRKLLYSHPSIESGTARVRFVALAESSLDIEIFSYVLTRDNPIFLAIREDLLLRIMDIISGAGTGLAFPSRTLYMSRDRGTAQDRTTVVQQEVEKWREDHSLPFPDYPPEVIQKMKNSIQYPDESSAVRQK